ncbi:hypothetical protein QQM39_09025 [Streptomyces sp. DT2A-34]|nr:hypothetical protein [Streptomyces sp. DT2A-34]MDO0910992.1 hypothetical protein [Streptomyces sp. DT2A-34]
MAAEVHLEVTSRRSVRQATERDFRRAALSRSAPGEAGAKEAA